MRTAHSIVSLLALAVTAAAQHAIGHAAAPAALAAAWQTALTQAKTHKAPVLAFVLPPIDAKATRERVKATWDRERAVGISHALREELPPALMARDVLLRQLQLLRLPEHKARAGRGAGEIAATRGTAVFALTIPVVASAALCGAEPGETAVLLGPNGKRLRGFTTDLLLAEQFLQQVGAVVLEPKALAARAANVPPPIARDVAALPPATEQAMGYIEDQELRNRMLANLPGAAPALVQWVDGELVMHHVLWALEDARPPLGTERAFAMEDSCVACGMGFTPPALTGVLKLLGA